MHLLLLPQLRLLLLLLEVCQCFLGLALVFCGPAAGSEKDNFERFEESEKQEFDSMLCYFATLNIMLRKKKRRINMEI